MTDTSGQLGFDSLMPADRPSSSASKSRRTRSSVSKQKEAEYQRKYRRSHRAKDLIRHARQRALEKGLAFDLDHHVQEVQVRISKGFCEVTGLPLNLDGGRTWDSPSLDRIVPAAGYLYSNTRIVCHAVNGAMGDWGEQVVIEMALGILGKRKQASNDLSMRLGAVLQQKLEEHGSTLFNLTWNLRDTPSGFRFYQLAASARRTSDNGSTSWPTPVVNDAKGSDYAYSQGKHDSVVLKLGGAARLAVQLGNSSGSRSGRDSRGLSDAQASGPGTGSGVRREPDELVDAGTTSDVADTDGSRFGTWRTSDASIWRGSSWVEPSGLRAYDWSEVVWLSCLDGKARPVEPELEPLAHGVSGRVVIRRAVEQADSTIQEEEHWYNRAGALAGFGNAIVPQLAAVFIEAAEAARKALK